LTPKLLIGIPSPRDIPEVTDNWTTYEHDVVVVKYSQQKAAYQYLREYFLEHEEYSHFCIMPDDLVVTSEQLESLWNMTIKHELICPLSGVCPVDEDETRPKGIPLAIQKIIPKQTKESGDEKRFPRDWMYLHDLPTEVFPVDHVGFSCTIITRYLMENVSWRGSTKINNFLEGNFDWQFSQDIKEEGYSHLVNPNVMLKHLRNTQNKEAKENPKNKQSFVYFINNDPCSV